MKTTPNRARTKEEGDPHHHQAPYQLREGFPDCCCDEHVRHKDLLHRCHGWEQTPGLFAATGFWHREQELGVQVLREKKQHR